MARGGRREMNGKANPNRTDLNAPKSPVMRLPGQEYGEQAPQVAQQQAVPAVRQQEWAPPPEPTPLHGPSVRPDEPVTHGLTTGEGAGPEVLNHIDQGQELLFALRAAYDAFPSADLVRLILDEESRRG